MVNRLEQGTQYTVYHKINFWLLYFSHNMAEQNSPTTPSVIGEIDVTTISSFLELDASKVSTLDPAVVRQLSIKANQFGQLKAQNLKYSVTLDELKSSSERRSEAFKLQLEKINENTESLRKEKDAFEDEKFKLIDEKANASKEVNLLKSQLTELKQQNEIFRSSKQDVVQLLNEKIGDLEASQDEAKQLLQNTKTLRKQVLELENEVQTFKSNDLRGKAEMQRLTQEMNLLKSNNQWLEKELASKSEEFGSYRQRVNSELQTALSELNSIRSELEIERSSSQTLKSRANDLSQQLQDKMTELKSLRDSSSIEKQEFTREMTLKQRLIDLLEKQIESFKTELESARNKSVSNSDHVDAEREKIIEELIETKKKLEISESKAVKLEETVDELLSTDGERGAGNTSKVSLDSKNSIVPKLHGDIGLLKKRLIQERRQKEQLQYQVEAFVLELEHKVPVLNSFKERTEMLEKELSDVALMLEATSKDKEEKEHELTSVKSKIADYETQIHSLVRQRSDLAHQVQHLLIQVSVRNDSNGPLTPEETNFIKKIINSSESPVEQDAQRIISERLVRFESMVELQEKNMELLNSIRNLADKLEAEEKESKSKSKEVESETVKEAKEAILTLQEYNKSLESQLEIIAKERDAFKILASDKGTSNGPSNVNSSENRHLVLAEEKIKELENHLSSLTEESAKNIKLLNEEIHSLYRAQADTSVNLEKERSSRILAEDRSKLISNTLEMTKMENDELRKRFHSLQENILKQDSKTQQTIESLISCKSQLSALQSQLNNSQSERDLLRSIQENLKKENESLSEERNNMRILITQLQTLQTERESLLEETQKNFQGKTNKLETELSDTLEKLDAKSKEISDYISTKDSQEKWYQEKFDRLNEELNNSREKLSSKLTDIQHLELKVESLNNKLEESEARIQSFNALNYSESVESQTETLRQELEKTRIKLADAYSQVEQYKSMADSSEESATAIKDALEQSKAEYTEKIETLTKERDMFKDQVPILKDQISNLNNELNHQKSQFESQISDYTRNLEDLKAKQSELDNMKAEYEQKISKIQEDLNQQTSYANTAQKNYEQELQKHADVSKKISLLRAEAQKYKSETETLRNAAENAKKALEQSELSWEKQSSDYEDELRLAHQRIEDLNAQSKILYDQIDFLSKGKPTSSEDLMPISTETRNLLTSLRREKDILETKLEVSTREEKVLRQKLKLIESDLEGSRIELSKLQRAASGNSATLKDQEEIMTQLNQLNLLRESNITLRNEAQKNGERSRELKAELDALYGKVQPLESKVTLLQNSVREKDLQISLKNEEAERWKQRSQDILHKYERIDPEEHQKLADKVSELQQEIKSKSDENEELDTRFKRLKQQAHEKLNAAKTAQSTLTSQLNDLKATKEKLENDLGSQKEEVKNLESKITDIEKNKSSEKNDLQEQLENSQAKLLETENKLEQVTSSSALLEKELNERIESLMNKIKLLEEDLEKAKTESPNDGSQSSELVENTSKIVENLKIEFEEEKAKMISDKESELREQFEEEKASILEAKEQELREQLATQKLDPPVNIDEIKKKWEEEYEQKTSQRIRESNEQLKKRIRLPTEEKINKIVEKKRLELEAEFEANVQKKAEEIAKSKSASNSNSTEVLEKHKQDLENLKQEMQKKFDEDIAQIKKRAFEEGKQQASMKSTFLEKKIAKLETQIKAHDSAIPINDNSSATPAESGPTTQDVKQLTPILNNQAAILPGKPLPFNPAHFAFGMPFGQTTSNSFQNPFNSQPPEQTPNSPKRPSEEPVGGSPEKKPKENDS